MAFLPKKIDTLLILAVLLASAVPLVVRAEESAHFPTNEELRHVRAIGSPRLSPDGKSVLVQIFDDTASGGKPHIWLVDIAHQRCRQLTYSPAGDHDGEHAAAWMPGGESVLFLAHRGDHEMLFRLPMQGGEAHPYEVKIIPTVDASTASDAIVVDAHKSSNAKPEIEPVEMDVTAFEIAPDGKTIAILGVDPVTPGEKKHQDEKADAVLVDHDLHGTRLYMLEAESGKLTAVAVPTNVSSATWAPKSEQLLVRSEAPNNAGDLGPAASSWLVAISDPGHPSKLAFLPPTIERAAWSQDGTYIYYLAQAKQDAPPGYSDLYRYSIQDHSIQNYSEHFAATLERTLMVEKSGDVFVSAQDGTRVTLARLDIAKSRLTAEHFEQPVVTEFDSNVKQTGWVYLGQSSTQPNSLYYADRIGAPGKIVATPPIVPANWLTASSQLIHWKNDGYDVEGLLYLPPSSKDRHVPLIVDVHGGPLGAFSDGYSPLTNFLVGHGWAVFQPNPRGSSGYGVAFAAANKNDLGGGDYRDIMSGTDTVLKTFPIDPDQLGLMGYSYGGEMAGFVEGKTNRFKGIVIGAPVIDQYSEYGTEDSSWYDQWYFGKPWEHAADAWKQSPLAGVATAKTPFLLLQGAADSTDPLGQAQEMYRALRQAGVPVQLVQYPRENHGPLYGALAGNPRPEPWHGFDARQRLVTFFQSVFGEKPATTTPTSAQK